MLDLVVIILTGNWTQIGQKNVSTGQLVPRIWYKRSMFKIIEVFIQQW